MMRLILLLLMVIYHQSINAEVYKCKNSAGNITYSESECPKNMTGNELLIEPNVIDGAYARGIIESHKIKNSNTSIIETTVSTKTISNSTSYMSSYQKDARLNQLKIQMSDQTSFYEKASDARNEFAKLNKPQPKNLSYELEMKRKNLKVGLTHPERSNRQKALSDLSAIYSYY